MYGSDLNYQTLKAEREREIADLLRERECRRAFQPEGTETGQPVLSASSGAPWRRLARSLHHHLPKTTPGSAGFH
jgi:hypothetical protein